MKRYTIVFVVTLLIALVLSACGEKLAPAPPLPTATPRPEEGMDLSPPSLARGQQVYIDKQCGACHGPQAEGGIGSQLTGITLPFDDFLHILRTALPPKPAFNEVELTRQDAYNAYGWLQSLGQANAAQPALSPTLPPGEVLGMTLWTEGKCDACHGAFAQGSPDAPPLVGISYPYEMERARMRQTANTITEHAPDHMRDVVLQRLYKWLQAGANPNDGC
jgi:mono/diheme cytochrome c family protein